jgi:peptide deformylase
MPNAILRAKSVAVNLEKDLPLVKKHIADLEETLEKKINPRGVGLSSPQIGKNLRVFSTYLPESSNTLNIGRPDDEEKTKARLKTSYSQRQKSR